MRPLTHEEQREHNRGYDEGYADGLKSASRALSAADRLREAVEWYREKAESLHRYLSAKPPRDAAGEAVMTALTLDAGNRGKEAMAAYDAALAQDRAQRSKWVRRPWDQKLD